METDGKELLAKRDEFRRVYLDWLAADPFAFQQAIELVYELSMGPIEPPKAA